MFLAFLNFLTNWPGPLPPFALVQNEILFIKFFWGIPPPTFLTSVQNFFLYFFWRHPLLASSKELDISRLNTLLVKSTFVKSDKMVKHVPRLRRIQNLYHFYFFVTIWKLFTVLIFSCEIRSSRCDDVWCPSVLVRVEISVPSVWYSCLSLNPNVVVIQTC